MKSYVFDTHTFVCYVRGRRVGRAAARALREIDRGRSRAWIPAVLAVELALLRERHRSEIGIPELEATLERNAEIRPLPLDLAQVREFALLPALRDPFDRLILAAARSLRCPLLSADEAIAASGLAQVIWD